MKKFLVYLVGVLFLLWGSVTLAADSKSYIVKASIPQTNGLSISISKVPAGGGTWQTGQSAVDFETLTLDPTYHIFRANYYYAVDVGINSNAADWTVTHTPYTVTNGAANLDSNINVTFVKQINDTTGSDLQKVSFANSNKSFSKSQLAGGWLRIYYGIATGSGDNPGVSVITTDKPYGYYQGSVTITLTP